MKPDSPHPFPVCLQRKEPREKKSTANIGKVLKYGGRPPLTDRAATTKIKGFWFFIQACGLSPEEQMLVVPFLVKYDDFFKVFKIEILNLVVFCR